MKTQENTRKISNSEYHDYQVITVLFVICSSFVLGAIPIIFGLGLSESQVQNIQSTELNPWSVLGERIQE